MIEIQIAYWHSRGNDTHLEEGIHQYQDKKSRKKAMKKFMKRIHNDGNNCMILSNQAGEPKDKIVLFIDKGRFRQC